MISRFVQYGLVMLALAVLTLMVVMDWDGGCQGYELSDDEYGALARITKSGHALPIGNLNFDKPGPWLLKITDTVTGQSVQSTDVEAMKLLRSIKFTCPGSDVATPHHGLTILQGDKVVYVTGVFFDDGTVAFQNSEFGYTYPAAAGRPSWSDFMSRAFPGYRPIDYFGAANPA